MFRRLLCLLVVLCLASPLFLFSGMVEASGNLSVTTESADNITSSSSYLWGNVTDTGDCDNVTARLYWGISDGGDVAGNWTFNATADYPSQPMVEGLFYYNATGLDSHTDYYFRSYIYGGNFSVWAASSGSFTTLWGVPSISNVTPDPIYQERAMLKGYLTSTGGKVGDEATVWIYWGVSDGGTNSGNWTNSRNLSGKEVGSFETEVTGLAANTTYYFRCYVENADESAWASSTMSFTTLKDGVAVVTTGESSSITSTGATLSATLTNDGGQDCEIWIAYGPTSECAYHTGYAVSKNSGYVFSEAIGGLSPYTRYYFRGVAKNEDGVSYGIVKSFVTEGVSLDNPDRIEVLSARVFYGVVETGDELYVIRYNIEYENEPFEPPEDSYNLEVMIDDDTAFYSDVYFYQYSMGSLYLTSTNALGVGNSTSIRVRMSGSSTEGVNMATYNLSAIDWYDGTGVCSYLLSQARYLEREMGEDLLTDEGKLNTKGTFIFRKAIPGVEYVCPNIFYKVIVPLPVPSENYTRVYESTLAAATGTKLMAAMTEVGSIVGLTATWVGFAIAILGAFMVSGVVYSVSGNGTAAMILGTPVLFLAALIGLMPLTPLFIGVLVITVIFAILFILGRFA